MTRTVSNESGAAVEMRKIVSEVARVGVGDDHVFRECGKIAGARLALRHAEHESGVGQREADVDGVTGGTRRHDGGEANVGLAGGRRVTLNDRQTEVATASVRAVIPGDDRVVGAFRKIDARGASGMRGVMQLAPAATKRKIAVASLVTSAKVVMCV